MMYAYDLSTSRLRKEDHEIKAGLQLQQDFVSKKVGEMKEEKKEAEKTKQYLSFTTYITQGGSTLKSLMTYIKTPFPNKESQLSKHLQV